MVDASTKRSAQRTRAMSTERLAQAIEDIRAGHRYCTVRYLWVDPGDDEIRAYEMLTADNAVSVLRSLGPQAFDQSTVTERGECIDIDTAAEPLACDLITKGNIGDQAGGIGFRRGTQPKSLSHEESAGALVRWRRTCWRESEQTLADALRRQNDQRESRC